MDHSRWGAPEPSEIDDHFIANLAATGSWYDPAMITIDRGVAGDHGIGEIPGLLFRDKQFDIGGNDP